MYFQDTHSISSTASNSLHPPINNPVRALLMDKEKSLWIGTKGDGIIRIKNYYTPTPARQTENYQINNSFLLDNSVYCFAESNKNILWIGTENGINYYSYREQKIKPVDLYTNEGSPVRYIHSIHELNDSTLWIATVGEGIVKAELSGGPDSPVFKSAKRILVDDGKRFSNQFFTIYKENDSILWFGNRGLGAFRLNSETENRQLFSFEESTNNQTANDIFSIHKNMEGYWFGTSFGVMYISNGKKQIFNINNNLPNKTIHGILEDNNHNLWFSTNKGIVKFNINDNTIHVYKHQNEAMVTEFSDGAFFKDENTGTLFFGGVDGFVTIEPNETSREEFLPPMTFSDLFIYSKEYNIYDFIQTGNTKQTLKLNYDQNFFSLSFMAFDYIDGNNYTYYYKIEGTNNDWVDNGISSTITFNNISHGTYNLLVKYRNNTIGKESPIQSLKIIVLPPWYKTSFAYFCYSLFVIGFFILCIKLTIGWYRIKKDKIIERMHRQQREEIYESKLRFFTNITHEFCTPLTLIYGPCEKILSYEKTDNYIQKYATSIRQNAERLNGLIQELIEFRRIETGNKTLKIRNIAITELMSEMTSSFCELAESYNINYQIKLKDNIWWYSDTNCLTKIISNLISNAFKYTPANGTITAELFTKDQQLHIIISNSGKGIKEEDLDKIFDRYHVLDSFEIQTTHNFSPRNGLGLAICHSMVNLLKGEIKLSSIPDEITTFEVILPPLLPTETEPEKIIIEPSSIQHVIDPAITSSEPEAIPLINDKKKPTIMLIDDDPSMLWFETEIFAEQYNIIPLNDPTEVMNALKINLPDLIISDVMMPGMDGISLTQTIKSNKLFCHIPLILLSANVDIEKQTKGIESGAEIYITKPFNVKYLEKVVARLLKKKEEMKDYYASVYSSFKLDDGHFVHKDDMEFFEKMMEAIESNISNSDLSVETLSAILGYGTRQFYRKLKDITDKTPADIIKEYRLSAMERLLVTTTLSIDEICDKVGFNNRSNLYKIFVQKFGTTPKKYRIQKQQEFKNTSESE